MVNYKCHLLEKKSKILGPDDRPVYSNQPPGEQVSELKGCGRAHHHSVSFRTRRGQEETERVHQIPNRTLVSSHDHQWPAAQETEHSVLREGVLPEELESSVSCPPPLPLIVAVVLMQGGRV